jgi:hypothetical protein
MNIDLSFATVLGILTIAIAIASIHVWRFGLRHYTDEQIQSGQDITVCLKVINGRTIAVLPFVPFSFLALYLAAGAREASHGTMTQVIFTVAAGLSAGTFVISGVLIYTLKNRAWPKRLIPPRLRTQWVSPDSIPRLR